MEVQVDGVSVCRLLTGRSTVENCGFWTSRNPNPISAAQKINHKLPAEQNLVTSCVRASVPVVGRRRRRAGVEMQSTAEEEGGATSGTASAN